MSSNTLSIIINADDYGVKSESNIRTLELMKKGAVTSATIMANGGDLEFVIDHLDEIKHCSLGVHLNITEFKPLTNNKYLSQLLNEEGEMIRVVAKTKITKKLATAIYHEWCAQIQLLRNHGIKISHLDSHHHIHTIPSLFLIFKEVQRTMKIRKARVARNLYSSENRQSKVMEIKKNLWNMALRNYYRTTTTDQFTDFENFYQLINEENPHFNFQTLELMVHPGNTETESFAIEDSILETEWESHCSKQIKLINYNQLN